MMERSTCVEWDEPRRSPENRDFCLTYREFIILVFKMVSKLLALIAAGHAVLLLVLTVTRHRTPMRMTLWAAAFPLAMLLCGVVLCHAVYVYCRYLRRHVRVCHTGVSYVTLAKKGYHAFADITRVVIEGAENGDHRLIVDGARGELCRLRVPSGFDVESVARVIPKEILERRDAAES